MSENSNNNERRKTNKLSSNQVGRAIGTGIVLAFFINQVFKSDDVAPVAPTSEAITTDAAQSNKKTYTSAAGEVLTARSCQQRQSRSERAASRSSERLSRTEARDKFMTACVERKNTEAGAGEDANYKTSAANHEVTQNSGQIRTLMR
jgi:hypothetical protein